MHYRLVEPSPEDAHLSSGPDLDGLPSRPQQPALAEPNDPLDDVFGSAPAPAAGHAGVDAGRPSASHPSDMPRLQAEHSTAGYREGVTAAKGSSLQAGFDEGFSLGATIGLRAGQILGALEGITTAANSSAAERDPAARATLARAQEELSPRHIFSSDYWEPDGNWKFEVGTRDGLEDVVFADVADAHPLVKRWAGVLEGEMARWKIDTSVFDEEEETEKEDDEDEDEEGEMKAERADAANADTISSIAPTPPTTTTRTTKPKQSLDW